jgi:hypothetical protein
LIWHSRGVRVVWIRVRLGVDSIPFLNVVGACPGRYVGGGAGFVEGVVARIGDGVVEAELLEVVLGDLDELRLDENLRIYDVHLADDVLDLAEVVRRVRDDQTAYAVVVDDLRSGGEGDAALDEILGYGVFVAAAADYVESLLLKRIDSRLDVVQGYVLGGDDHRVALDPELQGSGAADYADGVEEGDVVDGHGDRSGGSSSGGRRRGGPIGFGGGGRPFARGIRKAQEDVYADLFGIALLALLLEEFDDRRNRDVLEFDVVDHYLLELPGDLGIVVVLDDLLVGLFDLAAAGASGDQRRQGLPVRSA